MIFLILFLPYLNAPQPVEPVKVAPAVAKVDKPYISQLDREYRAALAVRRSA
jgi:hypothetical protein